MIIDLILFHFKLKVNRNTISASSQSAQYCYNDKYLCAKITFIHYNETSQDFSALKLPSIALDLIHNQI